MTVHLNVIAADVLHYARTRGVLSLLQKVFRLVVTGRERWYVTCGQLEPWTDAGRRDPAIAVRRATVDDLPALIGFGRQRPHTLRAWLGTEHFLFVAVHDGAVIGYRALGPLPHRWVADFFRLRDDQVYALDVFVHPASRGRGVTYELMAASNPVLLAHGYREVISIQRLDNRASIAMTEARGIARVGTLERRSLFGRVSFRFQAAAPSAPAQLSWQALASSSLWRRAATSSPGHAETSSTRPVNPRSA